MVDIESLAVSARHVVGGVAEGATAQSGEDGVAHTLGDERVELHLPVSAGP